MITHGLQRIRAHFSLDGTSLRVQANSEARFARALAIVRALDPSTTLLEESREPASSMRDVARLAGGTAPPAFLDPDTDPDVAAALDEMVRTCEAAWLDEAVPALAGRTPRQCADDPTRRPDLVRLLDSFPPDDGRPGAMSPARLRAALGLT